MGDGAQGDDEPDELDGGAARIDRRLAAMTNRIDRLADRRLVERAAAPDDRRKVVGRLTPAGLALVDEVAPGHLETERALLAALTPRQQADLARLLRTVPVALDDPPTGPAGPAAKAQRRPAPGRPRRRRSPMTA